MPLFEYRCDKCGHLFEALVRHAGDTPPACPSCGAAAVTKQFSSFAVAIGSAAQSAQPERCADCHSRGSCPYGDDD